MPREQNSSANSLPMPLCVTCDAGQYVGGVVWGLLLVLRDFGRGVGVGCIRGVHRTAYAAQTGDACNARTALHCT